MSSVPSTPIASKFASSQAFASARPRSRSSLQEGPGDVELGRGVEAFEPAGAADPVQTLEPVVLAFQHAGADQAGDEVGGAQLASRVALKVISFSRFEMSSGVRGTSARSIGLICTMIDVVAVRLVEQRPERRIAGVAAVPVGLAADLDRLEQVRQAGRRHDVVGGQDVAAEDLAPAGPDVGRRDEQLEVVACAQPLEIDRRDEMVAQRIDVERIERVGADELRQRVRPAAEPLALPATRAPRRRTRRRRACAARARASPRSRPRARTASSFARAPSRPPSARPAA